MGRCFTIPQRIMILTMIIGLYCDQPEAHGENTAPVPRREDIRNALEKAAPSPSYRMYALRVGIAPKTRRNLLIRDRTLPRHIPAAFSFWVIRGTDRTVLIDTGFVNRSMISKWGIEHYRTPLSLLAEIGIEAKEVTDVVVTHSHWDHVGAIHQFTGARIWISRREFRAIGGPRGARLPKPFRLAKKQGRLKVIDQVTAMAPGIALVPVGLHTAGFQFVAVKTRDGVTVFSSDIAPLWANFERRIATGQTQNPAQTLALQELIRDLVDKKLHRIVPGHEPGIYRNSHVAEITPSKTPK